MMLRTTVLRPVLMSLFVLALAFLLACGGDGDDDDENGGDASPGVENTADAEPTQEVDIPDGVPPLVVGAALRKDYEELAGLTFYRELACASTPEDLGTTPVCRENEDDGDEVLAFPVVGCEPTLVRPEQVTDAYVDALPQGEPEVVAAFEPQGVAALDANHVSVIGEGGVAVAALFVNGDGRVVALRVPCDGDASSLYSDDVVGEFIIEPAGGG